MLRHLSTAALAASFLSAATAQDQRPNIVIIYADDHAQHAVSAYGSKINRTPNIDALAGEGMRFTQSFVANSICGPSRATLLTGLHSHKNDAISNRSSFRDDLPTFAKTLQANGYATAMIGKWHLPTKPNGFSHWAIKRGTSFNPQLETAAGTERFSGHVTDVITEQSLRWIEQQSGKPFMIWISHTAAHRTWEPAIRHLDMYADSEIPEPATLFDDYSGKNEGAATAQMRISRDLFPAYDLKLPVTGEGILDGAARNQLAAMTLEQREAWDAAFGPRNVLFAEAGLQGRERTRWQFQRYIKNYLRSVAGLDDCVGRVRAFLADNDLADNTIVVYTSDQGFFLGEHGWYDKRWMSEESLRTPLIIHWPGATAPGSVCEAMVQNIDLAPTILDMARTNRTGEMHGRSLLPLLRGKTPDDWRDAIYYHYQMREPPGRTSHLVAKHYGIRTARYKLIYFYELDQWELYDLSVDLGETRNRYGDPELAETEGRLRQRLRELRRQFGDESGKPVPNDR